MFRKLMQWVLVSAPFILIEAEPNIWFIHDLAKINPQTGTAYEAGDLYKTRLPQNYREKNAVWDAVAKTVKLQGLRDEVVAFQIVVASDNPLQIDKIEGSDLKGPGTLTAPRHFSIYREWFMQVTIPSSNVFHFGASGYRVG